jgi:hypothetical protein
VSRRCRDLGATNASLIFRRGQMATYETFRSALASPQLSKTSRPAAREPGAQRSKQFCRTLVASR